MSRIRLRVNDKPVSDDVPARLSLADFLRERRNLTGTHLGCEHGVCGACTVLIDGEPARACLAYAVACDGLEVRTIEGFDDDALMRTLRAAFTREHALQCGFCTPGMLIAARDIVRRLPGADEQRIRVELSGNLCRCTGYLGIVNAVKSVIETAGRQEPATAAAAATQSPAGFAPFVPTATPAAPSAPAPAVVEDAASRKGWTRFEESFVIAKPPAEVWNIFADIPALAASLPGAELTEHDAQSAKGKMSVKLGPILAAFAGSAVSERDDKAMRGAIRGAGSDRGTGSRTKGEVTYRLAAAGDRATRVSIIVEYSLQGALAQFSRSSLAQNLGRRLVAEFAQNLNARLGEGGASETAQPAVPLNAGRLVWQWLRDRLRQVFGG